MAEKPKDKKAGGAKKPAEASAHSPALEYIFWIVLAFFLLSFLPALFGVGDSEQTVTKVASLMNDLIDPLSFISVFLSLLFGLTLLFVQHLQSQLRHKAEESLGPVTKASGSVSSENIASPLRQPNDRWDNVMRHINSESEGDWRLAIIEADIMLEEMLRQMGYHGVGLGDMLKTVEKSDFSTLDLAWEAHKVRNSIAHQGTDFVMSHDEAKHVVNLFKKVFEEFFYI